AERREVAAIQDPDGIRTISLSRDNKTIATNIGHTQGRQFWYTGLVKLWDATTGQPRPALQGLSVSIPMAAFSPDSRLVATGMRGNDILIWDLATGQVKMTLRGHVNMVHVMDFSPDGKLLASSGLDAR